MQQQIRRLRVVLFVQILVLRELLHQAEAVVATLHLVVRLVAQVERVVLVQAPLERLVVRMEMVLVQVAAMVLQSGQAAQAWFLMVQEAKATEQLLEDWTSTAEEVPEAATSLHPMAAVVSASKALEMRMLDQLPMSPASANLVLFWQPCCRKEV